MPGSDYEKDKQAKRQKVQAMKKKSEGPVLQNAVAAAPYVIGTFKEKRQNFWYHYKFHTLAAAFLIFLIAITIVSITSRQKTDASFTIISQNSFQGASQIIQDEMKDILPDYNEDGKKLLDITIIQLEGKNLSEMTQEMMMMNQSKLIAEVSTSEKFLYLLDQSSYEQLNDLGIVFEDLPDISKSDSISGDKYYLKDTKFSVEIGLSGVLNDMFFCLADFNKYDEKAQKKEKFRTAYKSEKDLLMKIIAIE